VAVSPQTPYIENLNVYPALLVDRINKELTSSDHFHVHVRYVYACVLRCVLRSNPLCVLYIPLVATSLSSFGARDRFVVIRVLFL